ncbi:hypothetical protein MJO28_008591 [Puccinia striiformis f. sp. tritici]|nr:hypothetical protein MJO28_008591 [Puccinia striiformis f. sp. tritici]POW03258.1 hypothetical protein PSHT_11784 [Puccinia striiformis]
MDENVLNNLTGMSRIGMDLDKDTGEKSDLGTPQTLVWVGLVEEQPNKINLLIAVDKDKH